MTAQRNTPTRRQRWSGSDPFPRLLYWIGLAILSSFVVWAMAMVVWQAVDQWRNH